MDHFPRRITFAGACLTARFFGTAAAGFRFNGVMSVTVSL
jgi:hypothetical protein